MHDDNEKSDSEILFPAGEPYTLACGKTVHVKKWGIETIGLVAQRIPALMNVASEMEDKAEDAMAALFPRAVEEVAWLIAQSVPELTEEQVKNDLPADDVLGLSLAVYDNCMAGPLAKIGALKIRGLMLMAMATTAPSDAPSSS